MIEEVDRTTSGGDFVEFWSAGDSAKGEFRCSECGYGVTVHATLPDCPMCAGGGGWERTDWSPLSRAADRLH